MSKRVILILFMSLFTALALNTVFAQLPPPEVKPIIGGRMPALSPDGKKIAFAYRGDIWIADSSGGRAMALTRNVEMDSCPQFSPDGTWVSFTTNRNGNADIYVVPAVGGEVRRMTYHSSGDVSYGWSPDGKKLIFCSRRDTEDNGLYTLDVKTLRLHKLAQDYMAMNYANYSPDGKQVVYSRNGFFSWARPRYVGSGAQQMWLLDTATGARHPIFPNDRQQIWPRFLPDGKHVLVVTVGEVTPSISKLGQSIGKFVDSPARTPNIWIFTLDGKGKQLTHFTGGSVRCPNIAAKSGDIVFEYEQDLWFLNAGSIYFGPYEHTQTRPADFVFRRRRAESQPRRRRAHLENFISCSEAEMVNLINDEQVEAIAQAFDITQSAGKSGYGNRLFHSASIAVFADRAESGGTEILDPLG